MSKQLKLINPQNNKLKWQSSLQQAFNFSNVPGWQDHFSKGLRRWAKKNKVNIKTLGLFSGGGGLDLGFHDVGFNVVDMVEIEDKYAETLRKNRNKHFDNAKVKCIDIRKYDPGNLKIDFVIGGPPCQTFSSAGRRAKGVMGLDDPRGNLFKEYVRLLKKLKPKAFLFENVYGIVGAQKGKPWKMIVEGFQSVGYKTYHRILDTADYGVPQHRERVIIVGVRDDLNKSFKFPFPTHGPDSPENTPYYSAGEAVKNLSKNAETKIVNGKYGYLLNEIPPGLNYSYYTQKMGHPEPVFGWRSKFSDFLYKADPEKPVRAIKAQGGLFTGPFSWENRFFHPSELKRLQTFPDSYEIVGSRKVIVEQIGNSVPPQLARILALAVLDQIFDVKLPLKIPYMDENHKLGFRSRKRKLSKEYGDRARRSISNLSSKKSKVLKVKKIIDKDEVRYLHLEKMKWLKRKTGESMRFYTRHRMNGGNTWELLIGTSPDYRDKDLAFEITVGSKKGWKLPYDQIRMISYSESEASFTALWKSFEENLSKLHRYADLVQLFGYYQYDSNIKAEFKAKKIMSEGFWRLVESILNTGVSRDPVRLEELASSIKVDNDKVLDILVEAKKHGYEVRNNLTNPQISEGHFLIPYVFPTLNSRSVQLSKRLTY